MSGRWLVAMSGGVDSSVAAAVLARQGLDVFGVTMDLGQGNFATAPASGSKRCCGIADAEDAREVARTLGIRHYTMNFRREFRTSVIDPFVAEYEAGRTPIPCVACNRVLKFDLLLSRARSLGAVGVATGHYARIESNAEGELSLQRAVDRTKDQTYFLFDMPAESLERVRFPIGELSKPQVRALAAELGLVTATKPESQGICFVPDGQIRPALRRLKPGLDEREGQIVDREGRVLGTHTGALGYTLGQRKGLGLADGPWYVTRVDPVANRLVVERAPRLARSELEVTGVSWLAGKAPRGEVRVQVRHRARSVPARLEMRGPAAMRIELGEPVWAPAAGQAAVVYDALDSRVYGGGWIAGSR